MLQLEIQRTGLAYSKQPQFPSNISCNVDKNIRCRKMCSFKTNFDLEAGLEPQQLNLFEKTSIPFKVKLNFHFSNFPLFKFCFKLNIFWTTYIHFRGKEHFGLEFISPFRSEVQLSLSSRGIHGGAYFSDISGRNSIPISVPGPCEVTEWHRLLGFCLTITFC